MPLDYSPERWLRILAAKPEPWRSAYLRNAIKVREDMETAGQIDNLAANHAIISAYRRILEGGTHEATTKADGPADTGQ